MRFNPFIVRRHAFGGTVALAAAALLGLASTVHAQSLEAAVDAPVAATPATMNADVIPATRDAIVAPAIVPATLEARSGQTDSADADNGPVAADPTPPGDDSVLVGARALDDQTLSRQRGGAVGMLMVAATPQLMHGGNSVTLWDEIAPPAPLPIPVDSSQAAQGNIASYTRK
ncbi:hypothetical protein [Paraburkholderia dinghuensis]|uniref:hypothetical protein n=1 Tax=Paraburkholderia dinghuensis TaxID=2305225 RepID=UPI001FE8989B|nr:hypothetical protein [Paraburkholderia dinghuensis]